MSDRVSALESQFVPVKSHRDARGNLVAFDRETIPFAPVRTFAIFDVPPGQTRAGHAVSCDEFLWVPAGSCRLSTDDGARKSSVILSSNDRGVLIPAGMWIQLSEFAPSTFVLVFASKLFSETEYFAAPRPDLLAARAQVRDPAS